MIPKAAKSKWSCKTAFTAFTVLTRFSDAVKQTWYTNKKQQRKKQRLQIKSCCACRKRTVCSYKKNALVAFVVSKSHLNVLSLTLNTIVLLNIYHNFKKPFIFGLLFPIRLCKTYEKIFCFSVLKCFAEAPECQQIRLTSARKHRAVVSGKSVGIVCSPGGTFIK